MGRVVLKCIILIDVSKVLGAKTTKRNDLLNLSVFNLFIISSLHWLFDICTTHLASESKMHIIITSIKGCLRVKLEKVLVAA